MMKVAPFSTDNSSLVHLDHHITYDLWKWFTEPSTPALSFETFCALLTHGPVECSTYSLYPRDIEKGRWRREFEEFKRFGKLRVVDPDEPQFGPDVTGYAYKNMENDPDFLLDDFMSIARCRQRGVPFRLSAVAADHCARLAELLHGFFESGTAEFRQDDVSLAAVVTWVFEIEVPELELRGQRHEELGHRAMLMAVYNDLNKFGSYPFSFDEFLQSNQPPKSSRVFVSPEELLALIRQDKELRAMREAFSACSALDPTMAEVRALFKQKWDEHAGRLKVAGYFFDLVGVCSLALGVPGAVAKPVQYAVNHLLARRSAWLLTLNTFNRNIRKSNNPARIR
jgi:hypothetical protein